MTEKKPSKPNKSSRRVLKQIGIVWLRDPFTGKMLFNPTDKRLLKNALSQTVKKVVPPISNEAAEGSRSGNIKPTSKPDSPVEGKGKVV